MDTEAAERAKALEAELDLYPDERGEILIEAANSWHQAGRHDRAIELLNEAVALGGEDGASARVELADVFFDLGRDEQAQAQLEALHRNRPPSPDPFHMAAELLEERGEHKHALTMFNMAVARLTEIEMEDRHDSGIFSYANNIISGRRRVREVLGLPPDELDESVVDLHDPMRDEIFGDFGARPFAETDIPFWPRGESQRAHQLWPGVVPDAETDAWYRDRESANRKLSAEGLAKITMVPVTTTRLAEFAARTGRSAEDDATE